MDDQRAEEAYINKGFSAWKKAPKCFQAHQESKCHKDAALHQLIVPKCQDVGELLDNQLLKKRAEERKYLLEILKCLRYLGRQGIALQGHDGNDNFSHLLRLLGTHNKIIFDHLEKKTSSRYGRV